MRICGCALSGETGHQAGRRLLAQMYREKTGKPMPEIAVTEQGKPYFPREALYFSISHTKHHAFCVLADKPVGVGCGGIRPECGSGVGGEGTVEK